MRLSSLASLIVIPPVAAAIFAALWLAAAAAYENVRFADTSGQLLSLIATAQDNAAKDRDFGTQAGEDLTAALARRAQIAVPEGSPAGLSNAWHRPIRMTTASPSVMELETDVPAPACRRLALFFGKDARDLKLQTMEARGDDGHPHTLFDRDSSQPLTGPAIDAACGTGRATLALTLRLR